MYNLDMTNSYSTLLPWVCYENIIGCAKINVNINNGDEAIVELMIHDEISSVDEKFVNYYLGMRNIIENVVQLNPDI